MKLIYVAHMRLPSEKAHSIQILKMCAAFDKNNVNTTLALAFRFQSNDKLKHVKNIWKYYDITNRFTIKKLPCFDLVYLDKYTLFASHLRFLIRQYSFSISAILYSILNKADVYYTRDYFFAYFFAYLKLIHRKKIYYECHKFEPSINELMKKGRIDGLITITDKLKERYVKEGISEKKILVSPDGVDLQMFDNVSSKERAREEIGISVDKKVICYAGHLYEWKGVYILATSMKYLPNNYIAYFVGGTDEDILKFKKFIMKNKIRNVIIEGCVLHAAVPKYLAASDVLILPNLNKGLSEYTSPLKLFEYMASRIPIVASDISSLREILNESNALFVEPNNPKALAESIKNIITDNDLAIKISQNASRDVQKYSWNGRAKNIVKFIGENRDK